LHRPEKPRKTCKRFNDSGHAHALTFSCFRRRAFLTRERSKEYLAQALLAAREKHRFHLWAYCVMPEHVHLLIWPATAEYSIAAILRAIKQSVARRVLLYLRRNAPQALKHHATGEPGRPYRFWQAGGGYDRNITGTRAALAVIQYIHENPVRRGLVQSPQEWPWSSAQDWAGVRTGPVAVDRESFRRV